MSSLSANWRCCTSYTISGMGHMVSCMSSQHSAKKLKSENKNTVSKHMSYLPVGLITRNQERQQLQIADSIQVKRFYAGRETSRKTIFSLFSTHIGRSI